MPIYKPSMSTNRLLAGGGGANPPLFADSEANLPVGQSGQVGIVTSDGTPTGDFVSLHIYNGTEWIGATPDTLYTADGELTEDRTITGNDNTLSLEEGAFSISSSATGEKHFIVRADELNMEASLMSDYYGDDISLVFEDTNGQFAPLVMASYGLFIGDGYDRVEFVSDIYMNNQSILIQDTSAGNEVFTLRDPSLNQEVFFRGDWWGGDYSLIFRNMANSDEFQLIGGQLDGTTKTVMVGDSADRIWLQAKTIINNVDTDQTRVEWFLAQDEFNEVIRLTQNDLENKLNIPTLYSDDGVIDGFRQVDGGGGAGELEFNQFSYLLFSASNIYLRGRLANAPEIEIDNTKLMLKTPKIKDSTASNNHVLTLLDDTTGEVEFREIETVIGRKEVINLVANTPQTLSSADISFIHNVQCFDASTNEIVQVSIKRHPTLEDQVTLESTSTITLNCYITGAKL